MPGGLLQIASSGIQDVYLTKNPEITFFKKIYRRHTNFCLETHEISIDQVPYYGKNFFINVSKYGDLLHRCFFKVELPKYNFDDSLIKNKEYKVLKENKLKNIEEKMNLWKTEYDTLSIFSEIQIIIYQKILLLLKSEDVTYQNINSQVLTLRNSYNNQLQNIVFTIDEDLIDKIDIINYVINFNGQFGLEDKPDENILTYETFFNNIKTLYENNLSQLTYYYSNFIYNQNKYNEINNGIVNYSWINNLGNQYFNNLNVEIDGQVIESYTNDYLNVYNSHYIKDNEVKNFNELIGNVKEVNGLESTKKPYDIYIPLIFWFNRNSTNALPLVSMKSSELVINAEINNITNLLYFYDYQDEFNNMLIYELPLNEHSMIGEYPKSLWETNANVNETDIIKMDYRKRERIYIYYFKTITKELLKLKFPNLTYDELTSFFNKYSSNNNDTIILKDWINFRANSLSETNNDIIKVCKNINFIKSPWLVDTNTFIGKINKPKIRFFAEYISLDELERFKFASSSLEYIISLPEQISTDITNNEYFTTEIDLHKPTKDIFWFLIPKLNKNGITKYSFKDPSILNKCFFLEDDTVVDIKFSVQDLTLIDFKYGKNYYKYATKYKKLNAINKDQSYYYSFALYPEEEQPSGNSNLSMIKGKNVQIRLNKEFLKEYFDSQINKNLQDVELIFVNRSHNLLKFEKGKGQLVFY